MTRAVTPFRSDFRRIAAAGARRPAVIDGRTDDVITYEELAGLMDRCGRLFEDLGVGEGDCVLVLLPQSVEHLVCFLAALNAGTAHAPLSMDASAREVRRWCELVGPKLCLAADDVDETTLETLEAEGVPLVKVAIGSRFDWLAEGGPGGGPASTAPGRLYLTTSGSTGEPRALVIDGDRLWSSARAFARHHGFLDENSRYLNVMPMAYLGGLFNLGLIPLATGGSVVVWEQFSGRTFLTFWQTVERFDVTQLWLVPTMVRGLLALSERTRRLEIAKLDVNVRAAFLGTAPIELETKTRFEDAFGIPLLENFALSETTFFTTETLDTRTRRAEGSVGEVMPYAEVKLVPVADDGDADGETPTEVHVASPYLFLGYLGDDGQLELPVDGDGYLATGDLGHMEGATLVIDGRRRDIIKKGGYLVSLREAETLAQQHDAVAESAAVPIAHDFYGEDYVLFVRLAEGPAADETAAAVRQWLHRNLVRHKWPDDIRIVDDFPRTPAGKIRKHVLAEQAAAGARGPARRTGSGA